MHAFQSLTIQADPGAELIGIVNEAKRELAAAVKLPDDHVIDVDAFTVAGYVVVELRVRPRPQARLVNKSPIDVIKPVADHRPLWN